MRDIYFQADDCLFLLNLMVGALLVTNIHFVRVWLAHIFDMLGGDRRFTRKYQNYEVPWSTRKVFVATQRQHCWDACTKTMQQQLLQLVTIIQERWIIMEKWIFVKSIRQLEWSDKKVRWRCTLLNKTIQIISKQGIKVLT